MNIFKVGSVEVEELEEAEGLESNSTNSRGQFYGAPVNLEDEDSDIIVTPVLTDYGFQSTIFRKKTYSYPPMEVYNQTYFGPKGIRLKSEYSNDQEIYIPPIINYHINLTEKEINAILQEALESSIHSCSAFIYLHQGKIAIWFLYTWSFFLINLYPTPPELKELEEKVYENRIPEELHVHRFVPKDSYIEVGRLSRKRFSWGICCKYSEKYYEYLKDPFAVNFELPSFYLFLDSGEPGFKNSTRFTNVLISDLFTTPKLFSEEALQNMDNIISKYDEDIYNFLKSLKVQFW